MGKFLTLVDEIPSRDILKTTEKPYVFVTNDISKTQYHIKPLWGFTYLPKDSGDTFKINGVNKQLNNNGEYIENDILLTKIGDMFKGCSNLTDIDVSNIKTEYNNLAEMFSGCTSLKNIDNLHLFNDENITSLWSTFENCSSLEVLNTSKWSLSNIVYLNNTFKGCINLKKAYFMMYNGKERALNKLESTNSMFNGCGKLEKLCGIKLNTPSLNNVSFMFRDCTSLKNINIEFNNAAIHSAQSMFLDCTALTNIKLSTNIVGGSVSNMFQGCTNITNLDLSNVQLSNITDFNGMFRNCSNLKCIKFGLLDFDKASDTNNMFIGCNNLTEIILVSNKVTQNTINKLQSLIPENCQLTIN